MLSLICAPDAAELTPAVLDRVNHGLDAAAARAQPEVWLDRHRAAEMAFDGDGAAALAELRRRLADLPVDINVLPAMDRRKKLLVSDMDATAIVGETLDELSGFTAHKAEIDNLTLQSVNGLMGFAETLVARMELMRGLPEEAFAKTWERIEATPGMRTVVATMRADGAYTALVSGGFTYFTSRVRDLIGFDCDIANSLELVDGRLTGRIPPPIIDPAGKVEALRHLSAERQLSPAQTLAVGDGSNDIPMLQAAGLGVAFRGKPRVKLAVPVWLDHAGATGLLYLQGFGRSEFVES
ncbi:MAG TPA: phosphoserine phosphatase SerB [Dongiaceae bacterium]|nr:phosphoserine phosphatase SerB [Dongiaceae bacterium]